MSELRDARPHRSWTIPNSWSWTVAGEIAQIISGGTPSTTDSQNFEGGEIPWITPADLTGYREKMISRGMRNITEKGLRNSGARLIPAGAVLFSSRAPIGYVAIANNPVATNQGFKSLIPSEAVISEYLYYYMQFAKPIAKEMASGTTFLEISGARAAQIPVPVAPLAEQKQIVAEIEKHFTRLDAATAALKRVQANLKRYRASVLRAACEGRLVPTEAELARKESRDYEQADKLLQRILRERRVRWEADTLAKMRASGKVPKDDNWKQKYIEPSAPDTSNLPQLSEGWCWARAEQLCGFITKGTTPAANKLFDSPRDVPFIKVYNLTPTGRLDFSINPTYIERPTHEQELARSRVVPGDVLMNIVGPPLGKVSIVPDIHSEWNVNQAIAIFRTIDGIERGYLAGLLMTEQILNWATQRAKATAGQFNLTLEICRDLPIPLPPANEQKRIVAELDRQITYLERTVLLVDSSSIRNSRARQSILTAAFTGQLVPQDPADEPASALLERIRAEREMSESRKRVNLGKQNGKNPEEAGSRRMKESWK